MLSRKFLKYLSSFQARMKTIFEISEVPVKQVASASSSAAACDRVAIGEAPAPCRRVAGGSGKQGMGSREWAAGSGQQAACICPCLPQAVTRLLSSSTTAVVHLGKGVNGRAG